MTRGSGHWRVGWRGDVRDLPDEALAERVTSMAEAVAEALGSDTIGHEYLDEDGTMGMALDERTWWALEVAHSAWVAADAEVMRRGSSERVGGPPRQQPPNPFPQAEARGVGGGSDG